jgi:hypothetical protein
MKARGTFSHNRSITSLQQSCIRQCIKSYEVVSCCIPANPPIPSPLPSLQITTSFIFSTSISKPPFHSLTISLSSPLPTQQQATTSDFGGVCGGEIGGPHGLPSGPDSCSAKQNTIPRIRAIASLGGRGNGASGVGCEIWLVFFIHMMCLWNLDCGCG